MVASALIVLACLASLSAAAPAEDQGVEIVRSLEDSYSNAASNPQFAPVAVSDPGAPDHALAPPPADNVAPIARHLVLMPQQEEQLEELVRDKRQYGYGGGYGRGYGRRGYGRRHRYGGYGGYPGGYGGYGGYPGGYGGGYGGYPGGGYGGYPGGYGGFGGSGAQSSANAQSFSIGGGFGPFQGSISSSQASSSAGGFGFGR